MTETAIRETAAPWFIRQAEFDGIVVILADGVLCNDGLHVWSGAVDARYRIGWGRLPATPCGGGGCSLLHKFGAGEYTAKTDDLEEANAAFDELERKLLAGELR